MCTELSDHDLMFTFTFENKWLEVKESEDKINGLQFDKVDIRFSPFEEMMIWSEKISELISDGFKDLAILMNLGLLTNYCWRLEFQARDAPHIHALLWLNERLSWKKSLTISLHIFLITLHHDFSIL